MAPDMKRIPHTVLALLALVLTLSEVALGLTISGRCIIEGGSQRRVRLYVSDRMKPVYTERDGTYSITVASPGSYTITPFPGGNVVAAPLRRTVTVGANGVAGVDFTVKKLAQTGLLRGRILDRAGGRLTGTEVLLSNGVKVTTDQNGIYFGAGLSPGRYSVTPLRDGYTFSPSVRSQKVDAGKAFSIAPKGRSLPPGITVGTAFAGIFDASLELVAGTCPIAPETVSGAAIVTQRDDKVRLSLPRLGAATFTARADGFGGAVSKLKLACRITGNVTIRYDSRDSAEVSGPVRVVCLGVEQCNGTFQGALTRR